MRYRRSLANLDFYERSRSGEYNSRWDAKRVEYFSTLLDEAEPGVYYYLSITEIELFIVAAIDKRKLKFHTTALGDEVVAFTVYEGISL